MSDGIISKYVENLSGAAKNWTMDQIGDATKNFFNSESLEMEEIKRLDEDTYKSMQSLENNPKFDQVWRARIIDGRYKEIKKWHGRYTSALAKIEKLDSSEYKAFQQMEKLRAANGVPWENLAKDAEHRLAGAMMAKLRELDPRFHRELDWLTRGVSVETRDEVRTFFAAEVLSMINNKGKANSKKHSVPDETTVNEAKRTGKLIDIINREHKRAGVWLKLAVAKDVEPSVKNAIVEYIGVHKRTIISAHDKLHAIVGSKGKDKYCEVIKRKISQIDSGLLNIQGIANAPSVSISDY